MDMHTQNKIWIYIQVYIAVRGSYLHIFHVGMIGLAIRPLWIANYAIVAVGQHMRVGGLEE